MKLTIVGGGGFRVPLVYRALLSDTGEPRITQVALHDVDPGRLTTISTVLAQLAQGHPTAARVTATTSLEQALSGADVVFVAMRVGGLAGRVADERVALAHGVIGQETTGAGGIAYGLRTIPVADELARVIRRVAPSAWVLNFTNPAGMITQAMASILGDQVVGICDSPLGLARRAARALHLPLSQVEIGYAGSNHLGWLTSLRSEGIDLLPGLLADPVAMAPLEETHLFGYEALAQAGAIPNEYLYYYDRRDDALRSLREGGPTRGEFLRHQQEAFYADAARSPERARHLWEGILAERNATYMASARGDQQRDEADVDSGGYEGVALAFMTAMLRGEDTELILNLANQAALPGLAPASVIELPVRIQHRKLVPQPRAQLSPTQLALVQQVKAVDQLTIDAARSGDPALAIQAFAQHPLVDDRRLAEDLLDGYRDAIPEIGARFSKR